MSTKITSCVSSTTKLRDSIDNAPADSSKEIAIVQEMYHKHPRYISVKNLNNKQVIIAVIADESSPLGNSNIYVIERVANNWKEKYNLEIVSGNLIENFEWVKINDTAHLYFDFIIAGGSMGNADLEFGLYDFSKNKYYHLDYSGMARNEYKQVEGEFTNKDSLRQFPEFLSTLEMKAEKSCKIYKPTKDDLNINHPKNASKKFHLKNPNLYSILKTNKPNYVPIAITSYKYEYATLFHDNIGNSKSTMLGSIAAQNSNKFYTVYSLFKDYVICYNKANNSYFVVWVPDDSYHWVPKMDLTEENILTLYDGGEMPEFVIDLNQMKIKYISTKKQ